MIKRSRQLLIGCVLLGATEAYAVPVSFEFAATPVSVGLGSGGVVVPAPFSDISFGLSAPISAIFTIETDTVGIPVFTEGDVPVETGSFYRNPVTQLAISIGDQQFNFSPSVGRSRISVTDLPAPDSDPDSPVDTYTLSTSFGPGLFSGPYSQLSIDVSLSRIESDLSLISSRDMVESLVFSENWNASFTIFDSAAPDRNYQIFANVTNLARVVSVPEPGTLALLALGFIVSLSGVATRKR